MYTGYWYENIDYKKGDIVYVSELLEYYICTNPHKSNNLTFPNKIDIYWLLISSVFLDELIKTNIDLDKKSHENLNESDTIIKTKPMKLNTFLKMITTNLEEDDYEEEDKQTVFKSKNNKNRNKKQIETESLSDDQGYIENQKRNDLKRKLRSIEIDLEDHKRQKFDKDLEISNLRDRLLLMNMDLNMKSFIIDKYDNTKKMCGSDYSKGMNWIKTVSKIPYGKYKSMPVTKNDSQTKIKEFFDRVKQRLDKNIYGLEDVKQEIMEFVAKKITNPDSRGHVLALYGNAGVGKTKLIRSLADALELPFHQINFGGLNDISVLTGHSETYVGSKPGKIAEIFTNTEYMNPIIYLDEIDKISESKATEIFGTLTHLLDEEQNTAFQDNYLSNITLDLSKVFFVLAFNDITKIDEIVSDRLKIIYINPPGLQDKLIICQDKMIPEILNSVKLKEDYTIIIDKEVIEYIISTKTPKESGVRQLRKNIEKIVNRLNYDILIGNFNKLKLETKDTNVIITRSYVDDVLKSKTDDTSYLNMYL
jgi:ATP-dependent Lon protease